MFDTPDVGIKSQYTDIALVFLLQSIHNNVILIMVPLNGVTLIDFAIFYVVLLYQ